MMNRFIQQFESQKLQPHLLEELESFFPQNKIGSVADTLVDSDMYIRHRNCSTTTDLIGLFGTESFVSIVGKITQHSLESQELTCLEEMYK